MTEIVATIEGMHCSGCENRVKNKLSEIESVRSVEADHEAGTARVTFVAGREDAEAVEEAIEALGYEVLDAKAA